ncbi:uroporphyrinogen-III synthase [Legionella nagasakiensis]|uniref:uroporphyrinogen-III synthase n=1 Tax=Legionella nagasakiensis TaxID=535290 RepID=UPI0010548A44|nr:uroporphyrinogen-III synthase [Legionella nagasakiensis]
MNTYSNHLKGLCLLNTRPKEQNTLLSQTIAAAGGCCVELPVLEIEPTETWLSAMPEPSYLEHAVFISPNAAKYFFSQLAQQQIPWSEHIQITAIGEATALALAQWHIRVDHMPVVSNSEHLVKLEVFQHVRDQTIILVKGKGGRTLITDTLRSRAAHLIELIVYHRRLPTYTKPEMNSLWHNNSVNIILFTSQQAIYNLFTLLGEEGRIWLCNKPCLVISERLAETASSLGIKHIITSSYNNILNSLYAFMNTLKTTKD